MQFEPKFEIDDYKSLRIFARLWKIRRRKDTERMQKYPKMQETIQNIQRRVTITKIRRKKQFST